MEWVETTGKTIEEALDAALDQLGVDQSDVEYDVLEEPKGGLFGRVRSEARIRARVRPTKPQPKDDRRDRRKRPDDGASPSAAGAPEPAEATEPRGSSESATASKRRGPGRGDRSSESAPMPSVASKGASEAFNPADDDESAMVEVADEFLLGLVERFGLDATTQWRRINEQTLQVELVGRDLGMLIGPKAQTLYAIQDLLRIVVHYELGDRHGRLLLDVAGYRDRRREALERFVRQIAADVVSSGERRELEPMVASDRKVVHDTCNGIDGITTMSEGEDPNRRVVILPAG